MKKYFVVRVVKWYFSCSIKKGLCDYYNLNDQPGANLKNPVRENKFLFLEDDTIQQKLISFTDGEQTHASFYLPQIHCSSCLYLLEHLHQMDESVISSKINFSSKTG
jgi:Cu+-exporting ATPase